MVEPDHTFNPVVQHFYDCLLKRALESDNEGQGELPVLKEEIRKYVSQPVELFESAGKVFHEVAKTFPLKVNP